MCSITQYITQIGFMNIKREKSLTEVKSQKSIVLRPETKEKAVRY